MNILSSKPRLLKSFSRLSLGLLLMATAALASSDTSLHSVQAAGVLKVCVPSHYPPHSTSDAQRPGLEIELAQAIANRMGFKLQLDRNRGWDLASLDQKVQRTRCQLIAGGVVDAERGHQQIEFLPPLLEIGWAMVHWSEVSSLRGSKAVVFPGFAGLDRLALSQYLKRQGVEVLLVSNAQEFSEALTSKQVQVGITQSVLARHLASQHNLQVTWVPMAQPKYALRLLGIWKGDRALKKEVMRAIRALEKNGQMRMLFERYKLATIAERCGIC